MNYTEMHGWKVCLLNIENWLTDDLPDPEDFLDEDGEEPKNGTPERAKYDAAHRARDDAQEQADARLGAVYDFLDRYTARCLGGIWPGRVFREWSNARNVRWQFMVFGPEVTESDVSSLFHEVSHKNHICIYPRPVEKVGQHEIDFSTFRKMIPEQVTGNAPVYPQRGESNEDWLARIAVPVEKIRAAVGILQMCGGDPAIAMKLGVQHPKDSSGEIEFLAETLIPRGVVTSMIGERKLGKSTIWLQLACAIIAGEKT